MRWGMVATGLALLFGAGVWATTARRARREVLAGALSSDDPRWRLAALVVLDHTDLRWCAPFLVDRAGQEVDPWVADALAGTVLRHRAGLPGTGDAVDLLIWATRRLDGRSVLVPPDIEVEAMVAALQADLAAARRPVITVLERGEP